MGVAYCEPGHAQDSNYHPLRSGGSGGESTRSNIRRLQHQQQQHQQQQERTPSSQHQQLLPHGGDSRSFSLNEEGIGPGPVVMIPPPRMSERSTSFSSLNSPFLSPIPSRYIRGCAGDIDEAGRRWRETLIWRRENGIDDILYEPQPNFRLIKECYPHFLHRRDKFGHPIYYELLGHIDLKRLKANGVSVAETVRYYIFLTEYIWNKIEPDHEHG